MRSSYPVVSRVKINAGIKWGLCCEILFIEIRFLDIARRSFVQAYLIELLASCMMYAKLRTLAIELFFMEKTNFSGSHFQL